MNEFLRKLTIFFGSRRFFYLILGFFLLEALWFVFSAVYPMAFDEDFHFGIIQIYSHQWSPFLHAGQLSGYTGQYGPIGSDPSYLYHYLMSFPYRVVAFFTKDMAAQVVSLRLLNVAMFASSLVLFRKVLLHAKGSPALVHISFALLVLVPIVPQLAAHVNYDNLFLLLVPLLCLSVWAVMEDLSHRRINAQALLGFLVICMAISLVKYAALPLVLSAVLFVLYITHRYFKGNYAVLWPATRKSFGSMSRMTRIVLVGFMLLGTVLFAQRYAVNVVKYKTPVPDCGKVLTVEQCSAYGPWIRDHDLAATKAPDFKPNPVRYMGSWLYGMWHRLFFAINGPASNYDNVAPLPIPGTVAIAIVALGLVAVILRWRVIFRGNAYLAFLLAMTLFYIGVLWLDDFASYDKTSMPVAVNGRYLLPVVPFMAVIMGLGISALIKGRSQPARLKTVMAAGAILLFLQGGGVMTFILRSDASWDWQNRAVIDVNNAARKVLAPVIIEGRVTK